MSAPSDFAVIGEPASVPHQASVVGEPVGADDHRYHPSRPHHHGRQHHRHGHGHAHHHPHQHEQEHKGSHDDDAPVPPPALGEPVPFANGKQQAEEVRQTPPPSVPIDHPLVPAEETAINGGQRQVSPDSDRYGEGLVDGVPSPAWTPVAPDNNPFSALPVEAPNFADDDAAPRAMDSVEGSPPQSVERNDADAVSVPEVAPMREAEEVGVHQGTVEPSDEASQQASETVQGETEEPSNDGERASEIIDPVKEYTDASIPATSETTKDEKKASVDEDAAKVEVSPSEHNPHADQSVVSESRAPESGEDDHAAKDEEVFAAPHPSGHLSGKNKEVTNEENADEYLPVKNLDTKDSPTDKATSSQASDEEPIVSECVSDAFDDHKVSSLKNEPAEVHGNQQEAKQSEELSKGTTFEAEDTPSKDINCPKSQSQEYQTLEPIRDEKKKVPFGSKMPLMFVTGIAFAVAGGLLISLGRSH